jgi:hypothetical protein
MARGKGGEVLEVSGLEIGFRDWRPYPVQTPSRRSNLTTYATRDFDFPARFPDRPGRRVELP